MEIIQHILPEIFLSISIMIILIFGVFIKESYQVTTNLVIISLILVLLIIFQQHNEVIKLFNKSYVIDSLSFYMKVITAISCVFILIISNDYIKSIRINKFEYPILILTSVLGMFVMIGSNDLIIFYMGLELQSLSLYVLAAFNRDNVKSSEAGLKYFVLSALSSGLLLYGCSLLYGSTGSTNFEIISSSLMQKNTISVFAMVFIIVGLAFKISAVPFHMWTPDVYEGAPTSVTTFFAVVPKIAALTVIIRFMYVPFSNAFDQWQDIIIFLSIASMILGSVAAIGQTNIKRLMAYSSIGHMGYALAGISTGSTEGIKSSILYLTIYLIMNVGAFSCIFMMKRGNVFFEDISELSGLSKNRPLLSLSFLLLLFSLAGIPPLAGFFAKFYIFMSVLQVEMYALAIIGLITTVISAFYYLRIVKIIYFDKSKEPFDEKVSMGLKITLLMTCMIIALYFINPSILIDLVSDINII
jgi:NADH-quinone oxidoreductase subunit N